jgi:glucokinase
MAVQLHLCGDVGATKTLLGVAIVRPSGIEIVFDRRYENAEAAQFDDLLRRFVEEFRATMPAAPPLADGCLGVAGPIEGREVAMTNLAWHIDADALEALIGAPLALANDFAAAAHGVDALGPDDLITLQPGEPQPHGPQLVIGAGSGLGVAYRVWTGHGYAVVAGEGGHIGFAPADALQVDLWRALRQQFGRVTLEHVVCGRGLARIYEFLAAASAAPESPALRAAIAAGNAAAAIAEQALEGDDALARRALDLFLECYGAAAGDHALAVLARGGVYVAGGIAPKLFPRLRTGPFLAAFNAKGDYAALAARFPVRVVMNERLGLLGAARLAELTRGEQ